MKKFFSALFLSITIPLIAVFMNPVNAAVSAPVHETFFDSSTLRSLRVPTAGLVITATTPGVVFLTPVTNKIYVNVSATTPNASSFMFPIPVGAVGNTEKYFKVGEQLAIYPDTGTTTVNMTTQVWRLLPQ